MKIKEAIKYLKYADQNIDVCILSRDSYNTLLKKAEMLHSIRKLVAPVVPQLRHEIDKLYREIEILKKEY